MSKILALRTDATMPFGDWWAAVIAEAERRGIPHLLGDARSHREAWRHGETPAGEVQEQIDAVAFFL